ncbi:isochorismatase family protein [Planctomycetes bacterium K23_9]|uniref:Isochorismatase family protein n=1 Tax=Stieleria marina TaxID=1930275 RepID=A0A517P393_9BACT|nr:Isochorismatase family protein [Planctomycetes bacterium K23_9]
MKSLVRVTVRLLSLCLLLTVCMVARDAQAENLSLASRSQRISDDGDRSKWKTVNETLAWDADETAIVVCDMWDRHWCKGATRRVGEMAPRMNEVLHAARKKGCLIIHCPSSCLDFYKETPMRKLAQSAPKIQTQIPLQGWCHIDADKEPQLPIDDSDGGCDCDPPCKTYNAWSRQIATLDIDDQDAITDSAEAFYLMKQKGIKNVVVLGVHTNMCVLGRPFSIRQMIYQGQNVVLMRDMTDTMYNSRMSPYVSHFDGNRLIAQHIERHWCPTITSTDFTGKPAFQFKNDH